MIELFSKSLRTNDRHSSKGNQLKWESDHVWYKADYTGYEGLAEYMVSNLLLHSSLEKQEFVLYKPVRIQYKSNYYTGAYSKNFLADEWQIITLERLFYLHHHKSFYQSIWKITNVHDRLTFIVEQVERMTGLKDFGIYLNKLLTIDAFFLNEDRHMHNIAVLMHSSGVFSYCPFFDHGGSLLSDTTMDYPLSEDPVALMETVSSKTISSSFDEQLDASEELFGCHISFFFSKATVTDLLNKDTVYSDAEKKRVETILLMQLRKYIYLQN